MGAAHSPSNPHLAERIRLRNTGHPWVRAVATLVNADALLRLSPVREQPNRVTRRDGKARISRQGP